MLINLSNHPSDKWQTKQLALAKKLYGNITDIQFPEVPPETDYSEVARMAQNYYTQLIKILNESPNETKSCAVHIQGEFTLTYALVNLLKAKGIQCIASTSKRDVSEENGKKVIRFKFVQFREY
jgi:hypothetical protein